MALALGLAAAPVGGLAQVDNLAQSDAEVGAWLQLRRDQATYRERVAPLDLREQRALDAVERGQALELEGVLLRQRQERSQARLRQRRLGGGGAYRRSNRAQRADMATRHRQVLQEQRLRTRIQQQTLPYHRR